MDMLTVRMQETRSPGRVYRWIDIGEKTVWWEYSGNDERLPPALDRQDMAAACMVFYAMKRGIPLHLNGTVSADLLENLEDLTACWSVWRPDLYRPILVTADNVIVAPQLDSTTSSRAVAAFSGGVDGSFTLLRHVNKDVGRRSRNIFAAVLIQGLDIPLAKNGAFATATADAAATLASVDVPLVTVRTNWREVVEGVWEMEFGCAVSTCLRAWQGSVAAGLLGSDEDYARLVTPWGSNPITFAMLSSSDFKVVYDGAEAARTEKVEYLADWPEGIANLRVCWAGPQTGRNCGACEKCLRTKLNFMAVGKPLPAGLAGKPTFLQLLRLRARNDVQLALLREIVTIAGQRNIADKWVRALRWSIRKNHYANKNPLAKLTVKVWRSFKSVIKTAIMPLRRSRLLQRSR